ncbi:MAG: orotidine-5'-phosphate decarboxylase [Candidatus Omnitrophota bacterium]
MKPELIVALDVDSFDKAKKIVNQLCPNVKIFKVGLQLFTIAGPKIIDYINRKEAKVFLDLKLFDIPNTVANAVEAACALKVKMLTLHIAGGQDMLLAAIKAIKPLPLTYRPLLIGVTVLTSQKAAKTKVLSLAKQAKTVGLDGVVCSVKETQVLKNKLGKNFIVVNPGIRPKDTKTNDQKRVATPKDAVNAGSDFIVVGRPILEAKNPSLAAQKILDEIK